MEIKILNSTFINEIIAFSTPILLQDFPDYTAKVAQIYANRYFNKSYYRKFFKSKENYAWGVCDNEKMYGFMSVKEEYGGVIFIDLLLIHPEKRQKGIGTLLLKTVENHALSRHFHYIWLFTESQKNIEFYKHRGFYFVGTHKKAWYGENEHIMGKVLRDKPFMEVFKKI